MAVMDKLPKEAREGFIWTLLQSRAVEVVEHIEHLKEHEYQKEGGDKVLFDLLDRRWHERDRTDEIGENISEALSLRSKEGELLRTWCARSRECFDRCSRKTGVTFPEEAKGWLLLQHSGLSEERAVVLARTGDDLKFDTLSQAMRSCFPEFAAPQARGLSIIFTVLREEGLHVLKWRVGRLLVVAIVLGPASNNPRWTTTPLPSGGRCETSGDAGNQGTGQGNAE